MKNDKICVILVKITLKTMKNDKIGVILLKIQ